MLDSTAGEMKIAMTCMMVMEKVRGHEDAESRESRNFPKWITMARTMMTKPAAFHVHLVS